ncbi:unnamed protein product [Cuscuta campestris]|uniref:At1g61320/AtMIF1 LRR domain-containing protein n=1 Tax=Cuscuta campestris TaxID=132261 RepID=A0A484NQL2_9ASTE|nr:unnamed protein product [Cuscuta campestris]
MGLLPIQQAAKIAVLSKVWRDAWSGLTRCCFDHHFFLYFENRPREEANECIEKPLCWNVIKKVILEHKGSIRKFVFLFSSFRKVNVRLQPCDLDESLLLVTQRGVEEIHLSFGFNEYKLPECVTSCSTLVRLYLQGFSIDPQNATWTLPSATSLSFDFVYFGTRNLSNYVFDVPKLENLSFINCKDVFLFDITTRNLHNLTINSCYSSKIGSFLPVNMDLKSICTLAFDIDSLQDFFCKTTTKGLSIQLPTLNVELLKLSGFCFQDKAGVSAFVRLLCKCPKLRSLEIKFQTVCDKWTNINKCMDEARAVDKTQ